MLRMFFFRECFFVNFSPFFGKPFSRGPFEGLRRHFGRSLPIIWHFACFVESEKLCDRQAQGVEHHLGRDARHAAPSHPLVTVIVLQDAERPLDLYASIDPKLDSLRRQQIRLGLRFHGQIIQVHLKDLFIGAGSAFDESEAIVVERASPASDDGVEPAARFFRVPPRDFLFAAWLASKANGGAFTHPVAVGPASGCVALPRLVFDEIPYAPRLEEGVISRRSVSCVGANVDGVSAVGRKESLDGAGEIIDVGPGLRDGVGGDYPAADDELDVVGGVHVRPEPGIVIGLQAHRRGVAVRLEIRLPPRAANPFLFLVFQHLQKHRLDRFLEASVALCRRFGQRLAHRLRRNHSLFRMPFEEAASPAKRVERGGDALVERRWLPNEFVFVRIRLEFAPVDEGVVELHAHLGRSGFRHAGEYLGFVREDDFVDELGYRRVIRPALLHHRDEPHVMRAGIGQAS